MAFNWAWSSLRVMGSSAPSGSSRRTIVEEDDLGVEHQGAH